MPPPRASPLLLLAVFASGEGGWPAQDQPIPGEDPFPGDEPQREPGEQLRPEASLPQQLQEHLAEPPGEQRPQPPRAPSAARPQTGIHKYVRIYNDEGQVKLTLVLLLPLTLASGALALRLCAPDWLDRLLGRASEAAAGAAAAVAPGGLRSSSPPLPEWWRGGNLGIALSPVSLPQQHEDAEAPQPVSLQASSSPAFSWVRAAASAVRASSPARTPPAPRRPSPVPRAATPDADPAGSADPAGAAGAEALGERAAALESSEGEGRQQLQRVEREERWLLAWQLSKGHARAAGAAFARALLCVEQAELGARPAVAAGEAAEREELGAAARQGLLLARRGDLAYAEAAARTALGREERDARSAARRSALAGAAAAAQRRVAAQCSAAEESARSALATVEQAEAAGAARGVALLHLQCAEGAARAAAAQETAAAACDIVCSAGEAGPRRAVAEEEEALRGALAARLGPAAAAAAEADGRHSVSEAEQLARSHRLLLPLAVAVEGAKVRQSEARSSRVVQTLRAGTVVSVQRVCGSRAQIVAPARGWVSMTSQVGDPILCPPGADTAPPSPVDEGPEAATWYRRTASQDRYRSDGSAASAPRAPQPPATPTPPPASPAELPPAEAAGAAVAVSTGGAPRQAGAECVVEGAQEGSPAAAAGLGRYAGWRLASVNGAPASPARLGALSEEGAQLLSFSPAAGEHPQPRRGAPEPPPPQPSAPPAPPVEVEVYKGAEPLGLQFAEGDALLLESVKEGSIAHREGLHRWAGRLLTHVNGEAVAVRTDLKAFAGSETLLLRFGPPAQQPASAAPAGRGGGWREQVGALREQAAPLRSAAAATVGRGLHALRSAAARAAPE
eukprot:TRINITY_DN11197_c0_g1_i1.p1 TRINITY_DN11197_c0_g1~~TRINITY_DN11197_c0_g1_i1.p1  ORF type:complete len:852 (+),score=287.38 TRINITY_DN11197_c0_g1_i1:73-2628(+)